jgi:hypothetical protein
VIISVGGAGCEERGGEGERAREREGERARMEDNKNLYIWKSCC